MREKGLDPRILAPIAHGRRYPFRVEAALSLTLKHPPEIALRVVPLMWKSNGLRARPAVGPSVVLVHISALRAGEPLPSRFLASGELTAFEPAPLDNARAAPCPDRSPAWRGHG